MYIHSYINYDSVSWGSTCRTNLKKINSQQKHALRIIFNKSKFDHASELFKSRKIVKVYKLSIFNTAVFMHKIQGKSAPSIFFPKFRKPSHLYPTRFSHLNYVKPTPKLNKCKYGISYRGPFIWNHFPSTADKKITDVAKFKAATKSKLLSLKKETSSVKSSDPGHFLKSQGKFFLSFPCTLFYIFLTPKNYKSSL